MQLDGSSKDLTGDFDTLSALLFPITGTLAAADVGLKLMIEGFNNFAAGLLKFEIWRLNTFGGSQEEKDKMANNLAYLNKVIKENADSRAASFRNASINADSIRYGGRQGYANKIKQDIASKQAKLGTLGTFEDEYKKVNNDLYALRLRLAQITPKPTNATSPTSGAASTTPTPTPELQKAAAATAQVTKVQTENATKLSNAGKQQVEATRKITAGWNNVTVTSQQKLNSSSSALAAAVNSAAAKIKVSTPTGPAGDGKTGNGPQALVKYAGNMTTDLGTAITTEQKNMPSGANLVIANSSETIIPAKTAANGMNLEGLAGGFDRFTAGVNALSKLADQSGLFGAGGGDIIGVGRMLLGMGLQVGMNPYFQYGRG
jgi:hypothetical protein